MDFNGDPGEPGWKTVNDNVMGGRSKGGFVVNHDKGQLTFSGNTNTKGGGFSSIQTNGHDWDFGEAAGIEIRFRGDQRTYQADLRKKGDRQWIPVAYRAEIASDKNSTGWQTVRIPFSAFGPTRMGRPVNTGPIAPSEIKAIGFMIYDKKDGPFKLEVDWIGVYTEQGSLGDMPPFGTIVPEIPEG
ncbi:MAG: NADH dehydrogenase [ubiquinone] 1 alpha subcomplex assembly factor 1 [Kiritimatiellia bacterium]|jgi:NADH dehydrogenase [ubiquinone] 1 alpha subcomplex assembly factor 1